MRKPTHPGALLRDVVLPELNLPKIRVATCLCISRQHLDRILNEDAPVTVDVAYKLGKFCGNGPDVWLNMQTKYDLWERAQDRKFQKELKAVCAYA